VIIHQKLLKYQYTENVTNIVSLLCVKYIFYGFIEALNSKGILNTLKMVRQPWNALTLQLSLSLRDK